MVGRLTASDAGQVDLAETPAFWLGSLHVNPGLCRVGASASVPLEPRVMQVLVAFAAANNRIVSRDALIIRCWDGRIVGDDAINRVIGRLRKLARDEGKNSFSIETINKIGYRLIGETDLEVLQADQNPASMSAIASEADTSAIPLPVHDFRMGSYKPGIAVLPFGYPPDDIEQVYFAEGMAEDIIAGLARSRLLRVMSRLSSFSHDMSPAGLTQTCADLNVRYLVRGQVRRLGTALRLSIDLIDGDNDETIWSGRYDRPIGDLFALQVEITGGIVGAIEPAILGHEQYLVEGRPQSIAYWDMFIRARHFFWRGTIPDFREATALLHRALALKPEDSSALALLAMTELSEVWAGTGKDAGERIAKAHGYATRAVAADNRDAAAHHTLGIVLAQLGQHDQAVAEQRRALQLNPFNAQAQGELARLLAFGGGNTEEALAFSDAALAASPTDPHDWLWLRSKAVACFIAGSGADAVQHARSACARRPDYFFLHLLVAACCAAAGDIEAARAACAHGRAMHPHYSMKSLQLGHPFVRRSDLENFVNALKAAGWTG